MSAVILFDGVCNLCNSSVAFILKRDPKAYFHFASLQSQAAAKLLQDRPEIGTGLDSIVLLENGDFFTQSTAALRIARHLRGPWPLLYAFIILPRFLRDPVYRWVARNRYRWFGKRDTCMLPGPELRNRFLEAGTEEVKTPQISEI